MVRAAMTRNVQVVGRRVVNDMNVGMCGQRFITPVRLWNPQRIRLLSGGCLCTGRHRHHINKAEPANRIHVVSADESGPHEAHPNPTHVLRQACRSFVPLFTSSTASLALIRTRDTPHRHLFVCQLQHFSNVRVPSPQAWSPRISAPVLIEIRDAS